MSVVNFYKIVGKKTGKSLYEIWFGNADDPDGTQHVGYITRVPKGGWEFNVSTKNGQKIRQHFYFKKCKEEVRNLLLGVDSSVESV